MNKFVKFAGNTVGVVTGEGKGRYTGYAVQVTFHNGIKPTHRFVENRALEEITPAEFEQTIRKKGQTSMLQYLESLKTVIEPLVWHTDLKYDLPATGKRVLVKKTIQGGGGTEHVSWNGKEWICSHDNWKLHKMFVAAWAYEPTGPK